jgi:catechol 2,3-dioxygenase-like lactoylglutathione lyase family enzyme
VGQSGALVFPEGWRVTRPQVDPDHSGLRLLHWAFTVADLDASLAFYRDILGCAHTGTSNAADAVYIEKDGQRFQLIQSSTAVPSTGTAQEFNQLGLSHMTVCIEETDATMELLKSKGVRVREHARGKFVPDAREDQFLFEDPDGNIIETYTAVSPDQWNAFGMTASTEVIPAGPGVKHFSHWALGVADAEKALHFYTESMGWELVTTIPWSGEGPSRVMDMAAAKLTTSLMVSGDQRIEIIHFTEPSDRPRRADGLGLSHLTMVDPRLKESSVIEDPDGNRIEIQAPTE